MKFFAPFLEMEKGEKLYFCIFASHAAVGKQTGFPRSAWEHYKLSWCLFILIKAISLLQTMLLIFFVLFPPMPFLMFVLPVKSQGGYLFPLMAFWISMYYISLSSLQYRFLHINLTMSFWGLYILSHPMRLLLVLGTQRQVVLIVVIMINHAFFSQLQSTPFFWMLMGAKIEKVIF